jgi:protein involved in polysaccharide export with SLBB domain
MKLKIIFLVSIVSFLGALVAETSTLSPQQQQLLEQLPQDQRESVEDKMFDVNKMDTEIEEIFEKENVLIERPEIKDGEECKTCIFGYDMFKFAPSTFAPSNSAPLSSSYTLGPGDKIELNYYGTEQLRVESFISRDGTFELPLLGPINLAGLSIEEAKDIIKLKVDSELIGTSISFNLTELRSINVYVLGEAYKPGSYTLSSLSSVVNALYLSGGPNQKGSLRNINIRRGSKDYNFDLYDLLVFGTLDNDLRLQDGDIVFIPFIEKTASLKGGFKRPGIYEIQEEETLQSAIKLAGGFSFEAGMEPKIEYSTIDRTTNLRKAVRFLSSKDSELKIQNGDSLSVSKIRGIKSKSVEITGEVKNPGIYNLNEGERILDLINRAGGYTDQAYAEGIIFTREQVARQQKEAFLRTAEDLEKSMIDYVANSEKAVTEFTIQPVVNLISKLKKIEPVGRQVVDFNYLNLRTDPLSNFQLFDGDKLTVPDRPQSINLVGEVLNPTTLQFKPNQSIEEYIRLSGGLTSNADKNRIFIILPNGQSYPYKKRLFGGYSNILPGSSIVISRDTRNFDTISLAKFVTPILADLATSAAAIAAISNN